ncbi:glycosyltransferase family 39 protein [Argonema antarcticum]|uniref:glycosyltransferase family 39 protein n=1 Tax=Argonema antarcticum TaxID=2942763 RepID=UPI002011D320|nr:glycosyltransferase family 39 protein [Argonema antarcticum]MCL1469352.1 glycosyltransferase family 39 protein [Argonema antarcticum A004/B2]
MRSKLTQNSSLHTTWLRLLIILILVLGVFFRFVNLDKKVYWPDEAVTSLRISGYTVRELVRQVFDGHEIGIEDLQKYQHINSEKNVIDTIQGLAMEEPQLPPLYFVMVRFWAQWCGDSVAAIRSLSALISLLAFPCIYWLCQELFESPQVGWVAISLIAVSPFHVLYAQEARPYSLWIVTILLSSVTLLRAMRVQTKLSWGIYAASMVLGFYTFLFSGLVAIGYGIYVFATEGFKFSQRVIAFLVASLVALLAFVPWLLAFAVNLSKAEGGTDWAARKVSLFSLITMWAGNVSRIFFDLGVGSDDPLIKVFPLIPVILIFLIIVVYSIYFLCCRTPKRVWLFVLMLIGVSASALIVPDLIVGGRRSGVARYTIACYLGIQLAVAYLLGTQITSISINIRRQRLWQFLAIIVFSSGVLSCAVSSQAQIWWNKGPDRTKYNPQVAYIINQAKHPLLLSDANPAHVLSLSYLLAAQVRYQLVNKPKVFKINYGFSEVFLYKPSDKFKQALEKQENRKFKPNKELGKFQNNLWQLEKLSSE